MSSKDDPMEEEAPDGPVGGKNCV